MTEVLTQLPDSSHGTPAKQPAKPATRIALDDVTEHNKLQLKKINMSILPVQYNDSFYKEIVASEIHCCKLAYYNDLVVGGMCFRLENSADTEIGINRGPMREADTTKVVNADRKRVYIMTLGCLTPYRRNGVGSKLVEFIKQQAVDYGDVDGIYLHVQTSNEAAKAFYERNGFSVVGDIHKDYYKRVEPRDAYLLGFEIVPTGVKKIKLSSNVTVVSNLLEKEREDEQRANKARQSSGANVSASKSPEVKSESRPAQGGSKGKNKKKGKRR